MGSAVMGSTNCKLEIYRKKGNIVADVYYVVRPKMVVSVLR